MKKVRVRLGRNSYDICVGSGLLANVGRQLKEEGLSDKAAVVTDSTVKGLYGDTLRQSLTSAGFRVIIIDVPEGEEQKSLEAAGGLYNELSHFLAERTTPVLALGGGVIGDLAGFVAATYLRGVPLVQVPTTLLAQVDSSIGGKVAVDHGRLKNMIGAFYQPRLVVSDIATLKTLPRGELSNGIAEIIKYGVIWDGGLFAYLEKNIDRVKSLEDAALEEVISRSAGIKAGIVGKDERDTGLRNILNYGHTIGHAIESASDFGIGHGEAVAIGMLAAGKISNRLGILDKSELERLWAVLDRAGLPTSVPELKIEAIIQAIKHDKKVVSGKIRFVLAKSIGKVFITDEVSLSMVAEVLSDWHEKA